jgi:hypothetical protein
MENIFLALIKQLNSSVFILIALLLLSFWIVYRAGKIASSFKIFESKNDKIDVAIYEIKDSLSKVKATTDLLYQTHLSTVKSHSPMRLTQKGEEISKAISAELKINSYWISIRNELKKSNPTNPYDIQVAALGIAQYCFDKIFTEQERNEIKTYAFQVGINLLEIYPIIGVIIRDIYLKEQNISLEDIDKHDPSKTADKK